MPDELDVLTSQTMNAPRDSGHGQNVDLRPTEDPDAVANLDILFEKTTGQKPPVESDPSKVVPAAKTGESDDKNTETDKGDTGDKTPTEGDQGSAETDNDLGGGAPGDDSSSEGEGSPGEGEEGTKDGDVAGSDKNQASKDDFDKIELPAHTSQKASDSFNAVKEKARAEIAERDKKIGDLERRVSDFEGKQIVTPEEKKELDDLRKLRARLEIEKDPEIVGEFDRKIKANDETIYKTLQEVGLKESQIQQIKDMGGPLKLANWDAIYEHTSPSQKRVIDARLSENELLQRDKDHRVTKAREEVDKYISERSSNSRVSLEKESKVIVDSANELLKQVEWSAEKEVPKDASDEVKKQIEEGNKWTRQHLETLKGLLSDRSPENHATLAFGTLQALYFRKQLDASNAELTALRERNKELESKMSRIKKAGSSSRRTAAPSSPVKPSTGIFETNAEDSLDRLREEVEGARA